MTPLTPRREYFTEQRSARKSRRISNLPTIYHEKVVAEKRKKGRINKPAHRFIRVLVCNEDSAATLNVMNKISAFLYTLSLNAPRNWVQKNEAKRG